MKILTYNIHRAIDGNNKITLSKISNYLKEKDFDIICLQEVIYPIFAKLKLELKMDGVFAANVIKPELLYGICILSKEQIYKHEHVLLSSKNEQRGFLCANILSEYYRLSVINTHLGLDKKERRIQISEILDYIYDIRGKKIICGDFNEKNISINGYNDMATYTNNQNLCTFYKSDSRIDYLFTSEIIQIDNYNVDNVKYSDHYPVIGEFR